MQGVTVMDRVNRVGVACGVMAALIWGGFPVVVREGFASTGDLAPGAVVMMRFWVAGLVMLPFFLRGRDCKGLSLLTITVLVAGVGFPYLYVVALGLSMASVAVFAIVCPGTMIISTLILGTLVLGDRPSRVRLTGIALILAGIVLLGLEDIRQASGVLPYILFVGGGILWSLYTVILKHRGIDPFHATVVVSVVSAVVFVPVYALVQWEALRQVPWQALAIQGGYQGIMLSVVALVLYSVAVRNLGAGRGSVFASLVPCSATVLGVVVLGEVPDVFALGGLGLVTCGMLLALRQRTGQAA